MSVCPPPFNPPPIFPLSSILASPPTDPRECLVPSSAGLTTNTTQEARPTVISHCSNIRPPPPAQGSQTPADQAAGAAQPRLSQGSHLQQAAQGFPSLGNHPLPQTRSRPPTWAEIAARRGPAPPSIPVWSHGFAPSFSSAALHPPSQSIWSSGCVPHALAPARPARPPPTRRQQPASRTRTSHPRPRPAAVGRPRQPQGNHNGNPTHSQSTQEPLIDLNC